MRSSWRNQRFQKSKCRFESLEPRALLAVVITEFLASNDENLTDQDGDTSDWIELHNPGPDVVELAGWHLTDDPQQLNRWTFPRQSLPVGSYLVVFASGKNRVETDQELHTNFKLRREGEFLALVAPDNTTIVSRFGSQGEEYSPQQTDVSYGWTSLPPSDDLTPLFMPQPTPGEPNAIGYLGFLDRPTANVDRGFYSATDVQSGGILENGVTLAASDGAPDETLIMFTTNGSIPDPENEFAQVYEQPIVVSTTTTLRFIAFADGFLPSRVETFTYLFVEDVLQQDGAGMPNLSQTDYQMDTAIVKDPRFSTLVDDLMSLPSVSLVLPVADLFGPQGIIENPTQLGREWERAASIEVIHPDGSTGVQENAGLRVQGAGSRARPFSKKGFQVFFRGAYGAPKLDYPYFGPGRANQIDRIAFRGNFFDSWTFNSPGRIGNVCCGYNQALLLRDQFGHETHADMGALTIAGNWVHLYLNGQYWGLYNSVERPDEQFAEYYLGGDAENYDVLKQRPRGESNGSPPEVIHGDRTAWDKLMQLIRGPIETKEVYTQVKSVIDMDQFIDYVLLNISGGNFDWPHNNWYAVRERSDGSRWTFFSWDTENFLFDVNSDRTDFSTDNSPGIIYARLRTNNEFRLAFADRVQKHLFHGGALTPEKNIERFMRIVDEIRPAMNAESARWGNTHTEEPRNTFDTWLPVVNEKVDNYFPRRTTIVLRQLLADGLYTDFAAPEFFVDQEPRHGGQVADTDAIRLVQVGSAMTEETLIDEGAMALTYLPQEEEFTIPTWTTLAFDPRQDPLWSKALIEGPTGIGFDTRNIYAPWIQTDVSAMRNVTASALSRISFHHDDTTQFERLNLLARYDDGFVAYLNGVEIARSDNLRVQLPPQAARSFSRRARETFEVFDVTRFEPNLVDGENVLALQLINSSAKNVDLLMTPKLIAGDIKFDIPDETIWYTLDGSDPRDPETDQPSATATRFVDNLQITTTTRIRTRSWDGTAWSAINDVVFQVASAGDFNRDGHLDTADIDLLAASIRDDDATFDLNNDGQMDTEDLILLVENLMGSRIGDANLDRVFDSQDLVDVFTAGEYEDAVRGNSTWGEGDWNGDGDFDSEDIVAAFTRGDWTAQ